MNYIGHTFLQNSYLSSQGCVLHCPKRKEFKIFFFFPFSIITNSVIFLSLRIHLLLDSLEPAVEWLLLAILPMHFSSDREIGKGIVMILCSFAVETTTIFRWLTALPWRTKVTADNQVSSLCSCFLAEVLYVIESVRYLEFPFFLSCEPLRVSLYRFAVTEAFSRQNDSIFTWCFFLF